MKLKKQDPEKMVENGRLPDYVSLQQAIFENITFVQDGKFYPVYEVDTSDEASPAFVMMRDDLGAWKAAAPEGTRRIIPTDGKEWLDLYSAEMYDLMQRYQEDNLDGSEVWEITKPCYA